MDLHTLNCQKALAVAAEYRFKLQPKTRQALQEGTASISTILWITKTKPDMVKRKAAKKEAGLPLPSYLTVANYDMPTEEDPEATESEAEEEDPVVAAEEDPEAEATESEEEDPVVAAAAEPEAAETEPEPEPEPELPVPAKRKRWERPEVPRRSTRHNKWNL